MYNWLSRVMCACYGDAHYPRENSIFLKESEEDLTVPNLFDYILSVKHEEEDCISGLCDLC